MLEVVVGELRDFPVEIIEAVSRFQRAPTIRHPLDLTGHDDPGLLVRMVQPKADGVHGHIPAQPDANESPFKELESTRRSLSYHRSPSEDRWCRSPELSCHL